MSTEVYEEQIEQLGNELRVSQELLFLVLDYVGEPVTLNIDEAKEKTIGNRLLDLNFDNEQRTVTIQIVDADAVL